MKLPLFATLFAILATMAIAQEANPGLAKRFELSGYFSMFTYGENVSLQSDLSLGINAFKYFNITATMDLGYRNYSLNTNDFLSISVGKAIKQFEFRIGVLGGIYTLWLPGYATTIPDVGGEVLCAYAISPAFSIRIKERIYDYYEDGNNLLSTSTLIGFCFSFGKR
jgi:hypothetical protein